MTLLEIKNEITSEIRKNSFPTIMEYETSKINGFWYLKDYAGQVMKTDRKGFSEWIGEATTKNEFCKEIQKDLNN